MFDPIEALQLALEPSRRDDEGKNCGGLGYNKRNGETPYGKAVAQLLLENNGTYRWDTQCPATGIGVFDTIYQAMAADINAPQGTLRERVQASEDFEMEIRGGVQTLAHWLDDVHGIVLYRCTIPGSGNRVVVITVHPDLVVDEATQLTAYNAQLKRDQLALIGQGKATLRRVTRIYGADAKVQVLGSVINELSQFSPTVPRTRQLAHQPN